LDDVVSLVEVTKDEPERLKGPPDEGVYISNLNLEGAKWNKQEQRLDESDAKILYAKLPVILLKAQQESKEKAGGAGAQYDCPVYK